MAKLIIINGDITQCEADAIVNAADNTLKTGGGVNRAVRQAAGVGLLEELEKTPFLETGGILVTEGYDLPCGYIIHTVPPLWTGGDSHEDELLASCYIKVLEFAEEKQLKTVAFPSLGTGSFGFPPNRAARIAVNEVCKFIDNENTLQKIFIVCFDSETYESYIKARTEICGEIPDI